MQMLKANLCRVQTALVIQQTSLQLCNILQSLRLPVKLADDVLIKNQLLTATTIICARTARYDGFVPLHLIFTENSIKLKNWADKFTSFTPLNTK